ncbi:MAG: zinc-dependent peptidase [Acidobacteria bacterium]|nr:zinc-dependent peptidase [Acidobacteriota bacterium]
MRVERPGDRRFARAGGILAVAAGLLVGSALAGVPGAAAGLIAGLLLGVALHRVLDHRTARRRAALAAPFPGEWREFLLEAYDHFERLPEDWRRRFEKDLRLFLAEKRITGVGIEATEELRLLVAASAVTLSLGWPDYEWDQLTEVLLYADNFDRDYAVGDSELSGMAHPWGTVILSVPALRQSFEHPDDGYHVGVHEFAHILDVDHTHFDGIPVGFYGARAREWVEAAEREMRRLRRGPSAFDDYGAHDPVEFLGVAVEAFFELPQEVRRRHREVYSLLSAYFGQDPAAWDDARGLDE